MADYLLDTSVLVDHLRGYEPATQLLFDVAAEGRLLCSCLSIVELATGMREHQEEGFAQIQRVLDVVGVDEEVTRCATNFARTWGASHGGIDPVDYVIAATAQTHGAQLLTCNVRHFPMIEDLQLPYVRI